MVAVLACISTVLASTAISAAPHKVAWRYQTDKERVDIQSDGSASQHYEKSYLVVDESAIRTVSEETISYHEDGDVLEDVVAYTLKRDGKRLDVPKGNMQVTSHAGVDGAAPAFSDYKDQRLVFPNVEVGDAVVVSYTIKHRKPTFRNRYSLLQYYSREIAYDDAELVVTAPKSFGLQQKTYNIAEPTLSAIDGDRLQWKWIYKNPSPEDTSDENESLPRAWRYQDLPTIEVSNFTNYDQIAAAYEEEATKRAVVDDRIKNLASDIVKQTTTKREQAEKLYTWVAKNIQFAGNCLSGGDVVPRPTGTVLDLKMGDCKDHATLLQALLAAEGIKSSQALIYSGSWYELPELPCWQAFNHVINYLPDFDVYADATSTHTPFGALPRGERGKPTIHTAAYHGIEQAPAAKPDDNWTESATQMTLLASGDVEMSAKYRFGGEFANGLSQQITQWRKSPDFDGGSKYLKHWLEQTGYHGSGGYDDIQETDGPSDTFSFGMHLRIEDYLDTSNPYGMTLSAIFPSPNAISNFASQATAGHYAHNFLCYGDKKTESLTISFPPNVKLLAVPRDVHEQTALVRFDASYRQDGNVLHVKRSIVDSTPGPVCKPEVAEQYAKIGTAVKKDSKAQAVYEPKSH